MKERAILFRGAMVRAILAGRKTQTRRVLRPQPWYGSRVPGGPHFIWPPGSGQRFDAVPSKHGNWMAFAGDQQAAIASLCPYGVAGGRLWVRETWRENVPPSGWIYRATDSVSFDDERPWRPAIFMPRAACRLVLEIEAVRVERLQDISEEDARAEGVAPYEPAEGDGGATEGPAWNRIQFSHGWDALNAKRGYGWASNPWVWCITFRRLDQAARASA